MMNSRRLTSLSNSSGRLNYYRPLGLAARRAGELYTHPTGRKAGLPSAPEKGVKIGIMDVPPSAESGKGQFAGPKPAFHRHAGNARRSRRLGNRHVANGWGRVECHGLRPYERYNGYRTLHMSASTADLPTIVSHRRIYVERSTSSSVVDRRERITPKHTESHRRRAQRPQDGPEPIEVSPCRESRGSDRATGLVARCGASARDDAGRCLPRRSGSSVVTVW